MTNTDCWTVFLLQLHIACSMYKHVCKGVCDMPNVIYVMYLCVCCVRAVYVIPTQYRVGDTPNVWLLSE